MPVTGVGHANGWSDSSGGGEHSDSGYIVKVELTAFGDDGLDVGCKRKESRMTAECST